MMPEFGSSVRAKRHARKRAPLTALPQSIVRAPIVAILLIASFGAAAIVGCNETAALQGLLDTFVSGPSDQHGADDVDASGADSSDVDEALEAQDAAQAEETAELVATFKQALEDALSDESLAAADASDGDAQPEELDAELPPEGEFVEGRLLVRFRDLPEKAVQRLLAAAGARGASEIPHIGVKIVDLPPNASEKAYLRAFRQMKEVEFAERDAIHYPHATPNDTQYSQQWHPPRIAAPTAWDYTTGSASVIVAILDTGCLPTHPDLASKYVPGWNFYDNNADTNDVTGHGTGVAGCAAAATNNGAGVAGVGWNCLLMPIRVSAPTGGGSTSAMANGLVWAANQGARVANLSYRVSANFPTLTAAAQYFQDHGGVVTAAAGNQNTFEPAPDNPYMLTVTATTSTDVLASFSNTGNNVDLAAPGASVRTTVITGGYGNSSGTSYSAPIVAGAAALVIAANPSLSGAAVQDLLKQGADDLGPSGWDTSFGWGRLNVANAVALAMAGAGSGDGSGGGSVDEPPPPPVTDPPPPPADTTPPSAAITFPAEGATVNGQVDVTVSVGDNVGVIRVELYVDGVLKKTANSAPFTNRWNTKTASAGAHVLQCRAYDAAGNVGFSPTVTVYK